MKKLGKKDKYIVTSALPYVNGVKHLGNLIGSLLPADIYARWLRLQGKNVVAICGTDEHGTPAELAAKKENIPVEKYVDKYYHIQKNIYERFGLSFDHFGRTSTELHHDLMHRVFDQLKKNNFVEKQTITQVYCQDCERFLPDRYVTGTCPHCGYERARGDQCEKCTKVLDSEELINPRCEICHQTNVVSKESEHFFLTLDKLEDQVKEWVYSHDKWPKTTKSIAKQWLKDGLQSRCITRDLSWGIPVNEPGFEDKVFYVWFDAPFGYISITQEWAKLQGQENLWKEYWCDEDTKLIQFLAKDNVPFHAITWPATLMGIDDFYVKADFIKGFQWLNYESGKFSTSQNRGIFTDTALELYDPDIWRYVLTSLAPERHDTDFTWVEFRKIVNSDLANSLGNFINRVMHFINANFEGKIPKAKKRTKTDKKLFKDVEKTFKRVNGFFEEVEFQKSLFAVRNLVIKGNKYFQEERPWEFIDNDKERAATILNVGAHFCKALAMLFSPFIPYTASKIYSYLGIEHDVHREIWSDTVDFDSITGNTIASDPEILFQKIKKKELKPIIDKYGGSIEKKKTKKSKTEKKKKSKKDDTKMKQKKKSKYASFEDFINLKLKIGTITGIEPVEGADSLLKVKVDLGNETRQLIAGLAKLYSKDELLGRQVVVVTNLKPKEFKQFGVTSQGMLLAAEDGKLVSLLQPDKKVSSGSEVH